MSLGLLLLLFLQDPPLAEEKERIRSRPPLTEEQKRAYSFPDAKPLKPRTGYSLCVVPLGFSDRAAGGTDLSKLFFGQVAEYYAKVSGRKFELRGKIYPAVRLEVERAKFARKDLASVLEALQAREGEGVLAAFDGMAFVAAGGLAARGEPLWPHKDSLPGGVDYILVPEEAGDGAVGIAAHEITHLLGLADKYDDERASVGRWCILGTGYSAKDPPPPCADCREKLGWTSPAALDPRRDALIVMEPDVARSLKAAVNADGTEALLFEMRDRLFIWHVGGGKTVELLGRYPSETSDRLTPLSDPPFRGRTAGARSIWVTDIRVEGGRAWFKVGPEAPLTALEEWRRSRVGRRIGD